MRTTLYALSALILSANLCLAGTPIAAGMTVDAGTMQVQNGNIMTTGTAPVPIALMDADYSSVCSDQVIAYSTLTAGRTVTLSPCGSPTNLKCRQIKDLSGNASIATPINLASISGTFDGLTSTAISEARGNKAFCDDGTNFFMMGAFLPSANASSLIQKADGNGSLVNAVAGTDFMTPTGVSTAYVPQTTTVNGHALSSNVTVTPSDLGLAGVATSGAYSSLSGLPTIPAAQLQSDWNEANTGLLDYIKNKPTIPSTLRTTSVLSLSLVGTGATGTQISSTKDSKVCVTASTSTTSTIGGPSTSVVTLKTFSSNSATEGDWVTASQLENDQTITLAIILQSAQVVKGMICSDVPAGYYVKIENSGTGTHTETFVTAQKTIYG